MVENKKETAWTVEEAMAYLKKVGLDIVDAASLKPVYVKKLITDGVNHWCLPCWQFELLGQHKFLRMDEAELINDCSDKITPMRDNNGVFFTDKVLFRFLKISNGCYLWEDVTEPSQVGQRLWEEIIAPKRA